MPHPFDPYAEWLGIALEDQPPNYYQLLGIAVFEDDSEAIRSAARRRVALLKEKLPEDRGRWSRRLLRDIAAAQGCLTHADRKAAYDAKLRAKASARASAAPVVTEALPANLDISQAEADAIPPIVRPIEAPPIIATSVAPDSSPAPALEGTPDPEPPPVVASDSSVPAPPVRDVAADLPAAPPLPSDPDWLVAPPTIASISREIHPGVRFPDGRQTSPSAAFSSALVEQSPGVAFDAQAGERGWIAAAPPVMVEPDRRSAASAVATVQAAAPRTAAGQKLIVRQAIRRKPATGHPLAALVGGTSAVLALLAVTYFAVDRWSQPAPQATRSLASASAPEVRPRDASQHAQATKSKPADARMIDRLEADPLVAKAPPRAAAQHVPPPVERRPELRPAVEPRAPAAAPPGPPGETSPLIDELPELPLQEPADAPAAVGPSAPRSMRVRPEEVQLTGDPKDVLTGRGLQRQKEYWLVADDDDLREHLGPLQELDKKYKAAGTALAKALLDIQQLREQLSAALQANEPAVVQSRRQKLQEVSVTYRNLLKTAAGNRGDLTAKVVHLAQQAERLEATYQNLSDDPEVLAALRQLGPTNRLGPTQTFLTNRQRLADWEEELLTDQTAGFWGDPDGNVFYVPVVVNERTAALFAVQPAAEINLIPASVAQEAGIEVAGEPQFELTIQGVVFQAAKVTIPSLRLGKYVSEDVEAFVVPPDVSLGGILNANAFPRLKLDVQVGQHLLTVRPLPPPR